MATGKMSWLIEKHKNGNVSYEIQNTHRNHGAISKEYPEYVKFVKL